MVLPPESSTAIAAYLALFGGVGFLFVFVNLLIGRFVRPSNPFAEKQEIYECGEPAIGPSFVQFDLRFYVVALVFIIFDVEVAFLFPWATVFGKSTNLANLLKTPDQVVAVASNDGQGRELALSETATSLYRELGVDGITEANASQVLPAGASTSEAAVAQMSRGIQALTGLALGAVLFFFIVLLIGFAYEWKTGALDWVRALARDRGLSTVAAPATSSSAVADAETVLSSRV